MLTAAITATHYFSFGAEPGSEPLARLALADLDTPQALCALCDSAYRLFYCCLPLYDRVKLLPSFSMSMRALDESGEVVTAVDPGWKLVKHMVDTGVAEFDPALKDDPESSATNPEASWRRLERDFLTPEAVEVALGIIHGLELHWLSAETTTFLFQQSPEIRKIIATRISESLRGGKPFVLPEIEIGDSEEEGVLEFDLERGVEAALDGLAGLCGYAARTGHDVYPIKYYLPLLLYRAVRDKLNYTGLRSFAIVLPVIDSTESYSKAHDSFAVLRKAVDRYQQSLVEGDEARIADAYTEVDEARHMSLKRAFDAEAKREIVTVTCLMTEIQGTPLRHFLPDDHFHLSLAMQHRRYLSPEQTRAFELLLDAVLLGIKDLGADGSPRRTLLASCAMQPLLDFTVSSQCQRLKLTEKPKETLGPRWKKIKGEIASLKGVVGKPLEHLGKCVLDRRNILSHPAGNPGSVVRTRGEALSDLCRLVDFIRFLDCTIPPTV